MKRWQHASLSLSILVVCFLFLYYLLISPALSSRSYYANRYDELSLQLVKYKKAEQQMERLKVQILQLKNSPSQKAYFLEEKPDTLAAADLQDKLKILIESHEGQVVSSQPIDDEGKGNDPFSKVTVKIHMRGNISTLQELLYALEYSKPVMFVDNIIIQNRTGRLGSARKQSNDDQLDVRLDVTGYIFKPNA